MEPSEKTKGAQIALPKVVAPSHQIKYKYDTSKQFRTVHANGAWGGVTPHNTIQIGFFNDKLTMPSGSTVIVQDGEVKASHPETEGFLREFEVEVHVSLETATALRDWLTAMIAEVEDVNLKLKNGEIQPIRTSLNVGKRK